MLTGVSALAIGVGSLDGALDAGVAIGVMYESLEVLSDAVCYPT